MILQEMFQEGTLHFDILKGHGCLQKTMLFIYNEPKNVQELLRGPSTPKKQEKPTNPNANLMKDKKQKHVKRSVYSVECGVWSVKCGVQSLECKVGSLECGMESVEWKM